MRTVVEVGDWEHECCGPAYERDTVVEVTCLVVAGQDGGSTRHVASHHDLTTRPGLTTIRGRVSDLCVVHLDGAAERIERIPSGPALRGFDEEDDGHLRQPWTGEPVVDDSHHYLVTLLS